MSGNAKDRKVIVIHDTTREALIKKARLNESFDDTIRRMLKLPRIERKPPGPRPGVRNGSGRKVKNGKSRKKGS